VYMLLSKNTIDEKIFGERYKGQDKGKRK